VSTGAADVTAIAIPAQIAAPAAAAASLPTAPRTEVGRPVVLVVVLACPVGVARTGLTRRPRCGRLWRRS